MLSKACAWLASSAGSGMSAAAAAGKRGAGALFTVHSHGKAGAAATAVRTVATQEMVAIDMKDLEHETGTALAEVIERGYGYHGFGVIAVTGVPGVQERRERLLKQAFEFANLPKEVQEKYENLKSVYQVGWSHGKETMAEGHPDFSKGSYYANPRCDAPVSDPELLEKFPSLLHPNVWPTEDMPDMEPAFKDLGQLMCGVGTLLGKHCDAHVAAQVPDYTPNFMHNLLSTTRVPKGRLLYYYPSAVAADEDTYPSWCGWHNDHGTLTALTSAMYFNDKGEEVPCPDDVAGLYIRTRDGNTVRVTAPPGALLFQIGESGQIHSGGVLQATPHSVRSSNVPGIGRATFAVFMQPQWDQTMDVPAQAATEHMLRGADMLPAGVPALSSRWNNNMSFMEFTDATVKAYHQ